MNAPHIADLWRDSAEKLTPSEKWTPAARAVVLIEWHAANPGRYLEHAVAEHVLETAYREPMPTITLAELVGQSWRNPDHPENVT